MKQIFFLIFFYTTLIASSNVALNFTENDCHALKNTMNSNVYDSYNILDLPDEIIESIATALDLEHLKNFSITAKKFLNIIHHSRFIKLYTHEYSEKFSEFKKRFIPETTRIEPYWSSLTSILFDIELPFFFNDEYYEFRKNLSITHTNNNSLTFSSKKLFVITHEIPIENNIQKLYLSRCFLRELPCEFSRLHHLKELTLNLNRFKIFPTAILLLENLEVLTMSFNYLSKIPLAISNLKKLKSVNFDDNNIIDFPYTLLELPFVERISFNRNKIKHINLSDLKRPKCIKYFGLHGNNLPDDNNFKKSMRQFFGEALII